MRLPVPSHSLRHFLFLPETSCWLGLVVVVIVVAADRFYIALFSALEQTHCALVAFDSASDCFV